MISKDELDRLQQYLKRKGVKDPCNADWYKINGLDISIDADYAGNGAVFIYLSSDQWLIACTHSMLRSNANPHVVTTLDYDGLMRLIEGGEMAYNNMENERALDEL